MANSLTDLLSRKDAVNWPEKIRFGEDGGLSAVKRNNAPRHGEPNPFFAGGMIRLFDVIISFAALLFLLPAMVLIAVWVRLHDGGPAFYAQKRIGRNGKMFSCFKFRSMRINSERLLREHLRDNPLAREEWAREHKLKDDPRITAFGHFIRKTSLDELPQLWNVLRGDMSLVGPRPIVSDEVVKYGRSFRAYASVMPGITGLWQVTGRNDVCYNRRVAMDRLFARRRSVGLYLYILCATIPAVLLQKGSY